MYITEVSIRRPVVAWVLSLILIVFGLFVYSEVPVRELPDGLQPPVVQVKVNYKSAWRMMHDLSPDTARTPKASLQFTAFTSVLSFA